MAEGEGDVRPKKKRRMRRSMRILHVRMPPDELADLRARARENQFRSVSEYVRRALGQVAKSGEPPRPKVQMWATDQTSEAFEKALLAAEARVVAGYDGTLATVHNDLEKVFALQAETMLMIGEAYRGFLSHTPAIPDAQRELFARSAAERYRRWQGSVRTLAEKSAPVQASVDSTTQGDDPERSRGSE